MKSMDMFLEDYELSRERFKGAFPAIRERWPGGMPISYKVSEKEDLTIDCIQADALDEMEKVFVLTTGQHGIEGYVGSAVMQMFLEEYLDKLNPENTGLVLVHAINPCGMKYYRKVNQKNVDLNRNFIVNKDDFGNIVNPAYDSLVNFISPEKRLSPYPLALLTFYLRIVWHFLFTGERKMKLAALLGQFNNPKGMYYGGDAYQKETSFIMDLLEEAYAAYSKIVHLDMHTGYGPRYQMTIVNAEKEKRDAETLADAFGYPLILKPSSEAFYEMNGDMIDWEYSTMAAKYPEKQFYAANFEFGTLGESLLAQIKSLHTMIFENQNQWHGARGKGTAQKVKRDFRDMYYPDEEEWRGKALEDANQALSGILHAEGLIK